MKSILKLSVQSLVLSAIITLYSCTPSTPSSTNAKAPEQVSDVKSPPQPSLQVPVYPFKYREGLQPMVAAHRGGGDIPSYPENCLESIQYLTSTSDKMWVEIDIRQTADGKLVLLHDASLDRTTTCQGPVEKLDYADLSTCRLEDNMGTKTGFRIPTLEQVLQWNAKSPKTVLALDIKQNVDYDDVIGLVRKHDQMEHVYFIAYTIGQAKALRRKAKEAVISVSIRNQEELDRFRSSGIPSERIMAFTGTIRSPKELYDQLHAEGIMTVFGTMGNIDRQAKRRGHRIYEALFSDGVDIISTDRPLDVLQ